MTFDIFRSKFPYKIKEYKPKIKEKTAELRGEELKKKGRWRIG